MDMSMTMSMSMPSDMPMPSPSPTGTMQMDMPMDMIPWLHFVGGDYLIFKTLRPSSHGALAGACIVLGVIAIFERWTASMRCLLEARWARNAEDFFVVRSNQRGEPCTNCVTTSPPKAATSVDDGHSIEEIQARSEYAAPLRARRLSPPFILSHEIARGFCFAFQAFLAYILMLAVMTFHAGYIISIIVGLGVGEVLFGRFGSTGSHVLH